MVSRAIRLAALSVVLALGTWTAFAQNLDAGKSPAQMFSYTCAVCHNSPRGLVKTINPGQLKGFLRQHYTTGQEMAGMLAAYVMQNGGAQRVETPPARAPKAAKKAPAAASDSPEQDADQPPSKAKAARKGEGKGKRPEKHDKQAPVETAKPEPKSDPKAAEPAETRPTEAKPAEAKPAETEPAESKPVQTPTVAAPSSPLDAAPPDLVAPPSSAPPPAIGPDGQPRMPDLPEPPPLSPDLVAPSQPK